MKFTNLTTGNYIGDYGRRGTMKGFKKRGLFHFHKWNRWNIISDYNLDTIRAGIKYKNTGREIIQSRKCITCNLAEFKKETLII